MIFRQYKKQILSNNVMEISESSKEDTVDENLEISDLESLFKFDCENLSFLHKSIKCGCDGSFINKEFANANLTLNKNSRFKLSDCGFIQQMVPKNDLTNQGINNLPKWSHFSTEYIENCSDELICNCKEFIEFIYES